MLGYDISWAAFNIIEVMSSSKFTYKVCMTSHRSVTVVNVKCARKMGEASFVLFCAVSFQLSVYIPVFFIKFT